MINFIKIYMSMCFLGSKQLLGDIKTQISKVTNDIPLSTLDNLSGNLNQVQEEIGRVTSEVERAERIR